MKKVVERLSCNREFCEAIIHLYECVEFTNFDGEIGFRDELKGVETLTFKINMKSTQNFFEQAEIAMNTSA